MTNSGENAEQPHPYNLNNILDKLNVDIDWLCNQLQNKQKFQAHIICLPLKLKHNVSNAGIYIMEWNIAKWYFNILAAQFSISQTTV